MVFQYLAKTDTGFTPLMTAVQSGNLEAIRMLVSYKADVNAQNSYHGKLQLDCEQGLTARFFRTQNFVEWSVDSDLILARSVEFRRESEVLNP